jgi:hypothetical protein
VNRGGESTLLFIYYILSITWPGTVLYPVLYYILYGYSDILYSSTTTVMPKGAWAFINSHRLI